VIVDPGFYTYNGDEAWQRYFRETRAHNTVVIDGESQSKHLGQMRWSHVAKTTHQNWVSTRSFDYVSAWHDGYRRLQSPVIHRRSIFFKKPEYWIVIDRIEGEGEHRVESFYHFAPMILHHQKESRSISSSVSEGKNLSLHFLGPDEMDIEIVEESNSSPSSGWVATHYGCKIPAPVARLSVQKRLPLVLVTVLYPFVEGGIQNPQRDIAVSWHGGAVQIVSTEFIDFYSYSKETFREGDFVSDAEMVFVRMTHQVEITDLFFVEGTFVRRGNSVLVELGQRIGSAAFRLGSGGPLTELSEPVEVRKSF
jgi:hypothetical protein